MKVAINKKYRYITLEENCPDGDDFEKWVMSEIYETHSIITVDDEIDPIYLRYEHFDYDKSTDTFSFNKDKYIIDVNRHDSPSDKERIEALEKAVLDIILGG